MGALSRSDSQALRVSSTDRLLHCCLAALTTGRGMRQAATGGARVRGADQTTLVYKQDN